MYGINCKVGFEFRLSLQVCEDKALKQFCQPDRNEQDLAEYFQKNQSDICCQKSKI